MVLVSLFFVAMVLHDSKSQDVSYVQGDTRQSYSEVPLGVIPRVNDLP